MNRAIGGTGFRTEEMDFDWIVKPFEDGASVPAR